MRGNEYAQLQAFAAVIQQGSFVRAAAHLGMSASALSQTIRTMEERLDVRLVNRTTRSVSPTEIGARLLADLLPALTSLDTALARLRESNDGPCGLLRINTSRLAAIHYLAPLIGPFLKAYPGIQFDIVTDERLVDIVAGGFDAGVRLGKKLDKDMVAQELGDHLEMMVVASADYLKRNGTPKAPQELANHQCLTYRWPTDGSLYRWEFERNGESLEIEVKGPLVVTEPEMLTRIALDGVGIAYLFRHQVAELIEAGKLIHILKEWTPTFPGFYLYYPSQRQMAPALRAFIDFVMQQQRPEGAGLDTPAQSKPSRV
jgi:DNA-binding transcriptional LysR family regulator